MIHGATTFEEATAYHQTVPEPQFKDYLYELMVKKELNPKDIIQRSGIERSYFYHILNGNKHPGRNIIIRIGLCMHASLQEINQLLRLAGLSGLYSRRKWDATIIYAISKNFTMEETNHLLISEGEEPLYREDHNV